MAVNYGPPPPPPAMLYDLNIAWSPSTTKHQLLEMLHLASSLGYGTVAINHTFTQPPPSNPTAPFPDLPTNDKMPNILRRATLPLSDPAASNYRLQTLLKPYDVLAVRPLTEKAFSNACLTLDVPIISLDLTQNLPFLLRPKTCMAAVSRGLRFEICYAQALGADARGRAAFIGNVAALVRATRGRGILISSEAPSSLSLRGPADVANLLSVWGLPTEKGMEALGAVPRSVVVNEAIKRTGFRGAVDIVQTAALEREGEGGPAKQAKQKRKGGDEAGQPGGGPKSKKMKVGAKGGEGKR